MKKVLLIGLILVFLSAFAYFFNPFKAVGGNNKAEIIVLDSQDSDAASIKLEKNKLIRSFMAFNLAYKIKGSPKIEPGGYYVSKDMSAWDIINELQNGPDLLPVTFSEGLRKEQIGEILKSRFKWSENELSEWNNLYSENNTDYREGVYFPDTYLIPINDSPKQIADRMIGNFNEKFAPLSEKFTEKNIKWTTALKIASINQREAGGPSDMPLIAGVIWNRLESGQKLDMDATIQYAKGKTEDKWWSRVTASDIRNIDSEFNTYKYSGLPPYPISNPGLYAIKAVLNPQETECLYYLHDRSREIHCSKTYEEHLENIDKYLN
jgi:UPF0755 protein